MTWLYLPFVGWLIESAARLVYRTDRLRCLGNGVVAAQAAVAFAVLARRAGMTGAAQKRGEEG